MIKDREPNRAQMYASFCLVYALKGIIDVRQVIIIKRTYTIRQNVRKTRFPCHRKLVKPRKTGFTPYPRLK